MAQFIARVKGKGKNAVSALGDTKSGIYAVVSGWKIGVEVMAEMDSEGNDFISVYLTSGTNRDFPSKLIGRFKREDIISKATFPEISSFVKAVA